MAKKKDEDIKIIIPPELLEVGTPQINEPTDLITPEQQEALEQEIKLEKQFGERAGEAAGLGLVRGLTFGISDQVIVKNKLATAEELREIKQRNKAASITGEAAGIIGPTALSGGTSLLARSAQIAGKGVSSVLSAGVITEKLTAKALNKIIRDTGEKKLAREIIKKTLPKTAGSAVEGSFFGAGQLISEDALGEAELNAENLLSATGTGAVFGGAVGSMFGPAEALKPIVSKAAKGVKKRLQKFVDPEDAALDLVGITAAKKTIFKKDKQRLTKDLPEYLVRKGKLGKLTSTENLQANVSSTLREDGKKIGDILEEIEEIGKINPAILPSKRAVYSKIVNDIDDQIINRLKDTPGFSGKLVKVRVMRNRFAKLGDNDDLLNVSALQKLRREMDELAGLEKEIGKRTLGEQSAWIARNGLRNEIDALAVRAEQLNVGNKFGNLFKELKETNKDYAIGSEILPFLTKKIDKEKLFSLTDLVAGGVAGSLGIESILGVVGVKKFLESDLKRRLTILTSIEKQNRKVDSKILKSIGNFFSGATAVTPAISTKILLNSNLGRELRDDGSSKKPKNKTEAFKNVGKNISKVKTDPQFFINQMVRNTARISIGAPNTASFIEGKVISAIQFLDQKIPRDASEGAGTTVFTREWEPSSLDLAKFERFMQAIEDPLSLMDELEAGTLTREHIEALKAVYPNIYIKMQEAVMEKVVEKGSDISYNRRIQLGILLDIPTDTSLNPASIAGLQANFEPVSFEPEPTPSATSLNKVNFSNDQASGSESLIRRRSES